MSQVLKPCDQEIFDKGRSVWVGDVPKHTAEDICFAVSAVTGWKFDWHYIGGRVHVKALAPAPPAGGELEVVGWRDDGGRCITHGGSGRYSDPLVRLEDHRAHVARLQAENAALQQRLNVADQRVDDLQSVVEQVLTNAERGLPPDLHRTLRKLVPEPASTQPVDEAEREPFEAWHRRRFKTKYSTGAPTRDIHGSVPDPNYGPPNQQQMWEAWNARAALLIPRDHEIPGTSFQRLNALANEGE